MNYDLLFDVLSFDFFLHISLNLIGNYIYSDRMELLRKDSLLK